MIYEMICKEIIAMMMRRIRQYFAIPKFEFEISWCTNHILVMLYYNMFVIYEQIICFVCKKMIMDTSACNRDISVNIQINSYRVSDMLKVRK